MSVAEGCRLMGIARSTYYDRPERTADDTAIVEAMFAICDAFEAYGYPRGRGLASAGPCREPQEDPAADARA